MTDPDSIPLVEVIVTFPAEIDEQQIQQVVAEFAQAVREAVQPTVIH